MDVGDVRRKIVHIGDDVFPKAALPHAALARSTAECQAC